MTAIKLSISIHAVTSAGEGGGGVGLKMGKGLSHLGGEARKGVWILQFKNRYGFRPYWREGLKTGIKKFPILVIETPDNFPGPKTILGAQSICSNSYFY